MNPGKAVHQLRKMLLFALSDKTCFRCKKPIEHIDEFSIDHKIPWLDSPDPRSLFFDINNIASSHLKCNIGSARNARKRYNTADERKEAHRRQSRESKRRKLSGELRLIW